MMRLLGAAASESARAGTVRQVEVTVALANGARVQGWLSLPATWAVRDLLNNVREPMLALDRHASGMGRGSVAVSRASIAWMCAIGAESVGGLDADLRSAQSEHPVTLHVAHFELHGSISTFPGVDWSNFLVGRAGPPAEFFELNNAVVVGGSELPGSTLVVNVALVATLADRN